LIRDKDNLAHQLRKAETKITELETVIDKQSQTIDERDNEIARLKALLAILNDIKDQRDALQRQLREHQEARDNLSRQIDELVKQAKELRAIDAAHF